MSDNWIILVPAEPTFVPSMEAAERAQARLEQCCPDAERIDIEIGDAVQFIHAGENLESVSCPACGQNLENWWRDAMGEAAANGFSDLRAVPPCCGAPTNLNDLAYDWPQAFATFSLSIRNPGVRDVPDAARADIERLLGCPIRSVHQRI